MCRRQFWRHWPKAGAEALLLENHHHAAGRDFPKITGGEISIVELGVDLDQLLIGARETGDGNAGRDAADVSVPVPLSANRRGFPPNVRLEITGHGNRRTGDHAGTDIGRPRAVSGVIDFEGLGKNAPIIDDPAILRGTLDALKGGNGHGRQQADDDDNDHDFHERKSTGGRATDPMQSRPHEYGQDDLRLGPKGNL